MFRYSSSSRLSWKEAIPHYFVIGAVLLPFGIGYGLTVEVTGLDHWALLLGFAVPGLITANFVWARLQRWLSRDRPPVVAATDLTVRPSTLTAAAGHVLIYLDPVVVTAVPGLETSFHDFTPKARGTISDGGSGVALSVTAT